MLSIIITSIISFVSTNIDDIFVLMVFYTQVNKKMKNQDIIIGQYLGIGILVTLSIIGAVGVNFLPDKYIGALGLLPVILGIKAWINYKREKTAVPLQTEEHTIVLTHSSIDIETVEETENKPADDKGKTNHTTIKIKAFLEKVIKPEILSVTLITIANGADNIGIYIPIFSGYSLWEFVVTIAIFIVMIGIWCFAGYQLANYPFIKTKLQKYKHVMVPVVYMGLGFFIILRSGILGVLFE